MPASGQWIRSIKDNPSGKVVADPEGNRREWQTDEDTARQLRKLDNDELSIEKTDLRPTSNGEPQKPADDHKTPLTQRAKEKAREAVGPRALRFARRRRRL